MEFLSKQSFIDKVFDYETEKEWNFRGNKPAIIDFYADWCGPCKMVSPILEQLSKEYNGLVDIYKIDTEIQCFEQLIVSQVFGIRSIPSILFVPTNDKPQMAVGALPKDGFIKAIDEVLGVKHPQA